ncbi:hypothetical protein PG999_009813 [Apiospora kogelbergensis]|uniref:Uncharacterized protein n=1 Tax=Apiospora kogelbergensis TaxID=1337665 RepID=A0AAW0QRZ2_9PEZI
MRGTDRAEFVKRIPVNTVGLPPNDLAKNRLSVHRDQRRRVVNTHCIPRPHVRGIRILAVDGPRLDVDLVDDARRLVDGRQPEQEADLADGAGVDPAASRPRQHPQPEQRLVALYERRQHVEAQVGQHVGPRAAVEGHEEVAAGVPGRAQRDLDVELHQLVLVRVVALHQDREDDVLVQVPLVELDRAPVVDAVAADLDVVLGRGGRLTHAEHPKPFGFLSKGRTLSFRS